MFFHLNLDIDNINDNMKVILQDITKVIPFTTTTSNLSQSQSFEQHSHSTQQLKHSSKHTPLQLNENEKLIEIATEVHIARVITPTSSGYISYANTLQKYFTIPRILKLGDIITVKIKMKKYLRSLYSTPSHNVPQALVDGIDDKEQRTDNERNQEEESEEEFVLKQYGNDKELPTHSPHEKPLHDIEHGTLQDRQSSPNINSLSSALNSKTSGKVSREFIQDLVHFKVTKIVSSQKTGPKSGNIERECEFVIVEKGKTNLYSEGSVKSKVPPFIKSFLCNTSLSGTLKIHQQKNHLEIIILKNE
jgi:hypothetical protein